MSRWLEGMSGKCKLSARRALFAAVLVLLHIVVAAAQRPAVVADVAFQKPALTAEQIADRLAQKNHERELALRKLRGTRVYRVQYHGFFGTREAEVVVNYNYAAPDDKQFEIVSESGTKFIVEHVIKGLLSGEKEAASETNRQRTAMSAANYSFTLDQAATAREATQYVLDVTPKNDSKFLYRGKVWVDARDFALTRIEAEPSKNPSFWVKKIEVHHRYEKVGDFWLPAENKTDSWIRMGGHAVLSIEYNDYKLIDTAPVAPDESARNNSAPTLPNAAPR